MTTAAKHNGAKIVYAHPIEDTLMQNTVTQFMKYEVGSEEGVLALIANEILKDADMSDAEKKFFDDLDLGYLQAESNIGEEELHAMKKAFARTKNRVLILGNDVIAHPRAKNIAKIAALVEKYSDFSLLVIPSEVNTLGVSLVCELDADNASNDACVGYNAAGSFVIGSLTGTDLAVGALNQQEGTFVSIDNRVVPTNVALAFNGYELNDLANACGIKAYNTVDYTTQLTPKSGFRAVAFDSLENFYSALGEDVRGYLLDEVTCQADGMLESVDELAEYNGTVIYNVNPVLQFNAYTNKAKQLEKDKTLRGSAQFATAARISDGDRVEISFGGKVLQREFKLDANLKGTIALNPTFDDVVDASRYRFEKSKIMRVVHE